MASASSNTLSFRARTGGERGQVLPLVALALVPLSAMAALTIDVGIWRYQQQLAQNAADGGALAAVVALANAKTLDQIYAAANVDTTANGFAGSATNNALNAATGVTITVNNPPASGPSTHDSSAVEVIVKAALPTYVGSMTATISARAVAMTAKSGNCIVTLDPAGKPALMDDSNTISLPHCGIQSNSGMTLNSGTINASSIGYNINYPSASSNTVFTSATPSPSAAVADPCSTVAGCAYLTANTPTGGCNYASTVAPVTLQPATYCYALFQGAGTITFAKGEYYFPQGFGVNSGVNIDASAGVTFYNGGTITTSTGTFDIVAPTTGNTAGVAIFEPASDTGGITFMSTSSNVLNGLVYAPTAGLMFSSKATTTTSITQLVAKDITLDGSATINAVPSSGSSGAGGSGLSE